MMVMLFFEAEDRIEFLGKVVEFDFFLLLRSKVL